MGTYSMRKLDLLNWKEFGSQSAPSITSVFESAPYPGMDKIVKYLEAGNPHMAIASAGIDALTGKQVMPYRDIRDDGEYSWSSMLSYYVKTYNMRLPKAFEDKVLHKA